MAEEIEAKILDIDVAALEKKLANVGAAKVGDFLYRNRNFDFPGWPLKTRHAWVRLRTDGTKTTLAYKQRLGASDTPGNDQGMEEVEFDVGSFDAVDAFLRKIGMVEKFTQEKKRTSWKRGDMTFDIDTWPRIPPLLEVEGPSWDAVEHAIRELGYDPAQKKICSATQVYRIYGIEDHDYIRITFDEFIPRTG